MPNRCAPRIGLLVKRVRARFGVYHYYRKKSNAIRPTSSFFFRENPA